MNRRILQIESATGCEAAFRIDGQVERVPLACWALVTDSYGYYCVTGILKIDRETLDAEELDGFIGYVPITKEDKDERKGNYRTHPTNTVTGTAKNVAPDGRQNVQRNQTAEDEHSAKRR